MKAKCRLFVAVALFVSACGGSENISLPTVDPVRDSFRPERSSSGIRVSISKASIGKEFLLQGNLISQSPVQAFSNLKSRIVSFQNRDGALYMYESSRGNTFSKDLPQTLLLTAFPIGEITEDRFYFDFNFGMSQLFVAEDWRASDFGGETYEPNFRSVYASLSYLESAKIDEAKNQFVVQQVAQLPALDNQTVKVKYYLSPYSPEASFKPSRSDGFDRIGYFEVAPQLEFGGQNRIYATKYSLASPITYAISANTPADFRGAIRDAVLYWNRAFGDDVVRVVDAPEGLTAPDFENNIIQWIDWDQAGSAYADAQMDPRTGQILHSQIYMTSAFAFISKQRAQALLRKLKSENSQRVSRVGLRGFTSTAICDRHTSDDLIQTLNQVLSSNVSDATILKISQDYVREVVAHEVGHTLGLRHNFAGSLAANYPISQRASLFKDYLNVGGNAPAGIITSSSVMEYQAFIEAVFTGAQIGVRAAALPYDAKAIQALYFGKKFSPKDVPLFCTDSHADLKFYADCKRFDYGSSIVDYARDSVRESLDLEPYALLETFIRAKAPLDGDRALAPDEVGLDAKARAIAILSPRSNFYRAMTTDGKLISVRRGFSKEDQVSDDIEHRAELDYLQSEVKKSGGMDSVMPRITDDDTETQIALFNRLVKDPIYRSGIGLDGQAYSFTDAEIESMKKIAALYFNELGLQLVLEDLRIQSGASAKGSKLSDHPLVNTELSEALGMRVKDYVFGRRTDAVLGGMNLPFYFYPYAVREAAAGLLKPSLGKSVAWAIRGSLVYKDESQFFEGILADNSQKIKDILTNLSQDRYESQSALLRWYEENRAISAALSRKWDKAAPPKTEVKPSEKP